MATLISDIAKNFFNPKTQDMLAPTNLNSNFATSFASISSSSSTSTINEIDGMTDIEKDLVEMMDSADLGETLSSDEEKEGDKYDLQLSCIKGWKHMTDVKEYSWYICNGDEFVAGDFELANEQRQSHQQHIKKIQDHVGPTFWHNFILVNNTHKREIRLYDGNHRYQALQQMSETRQKDILCPVMVWTTNTKDDKYLLEVFNQINCIKGTTDEEEQVRVDVDALTKDLASLFGEYRKGDSYIVEGKTQDKLGQNAKWRIAQITLKQELEANIHKIKGLTAEQIFTKMKKVNERRSQDPELFWSRIKSKASPIQDKMYKYKFYIGVDFPAVLREM